MGLRISDLIDCELCAHYSKDSEQCLIEDDRVTRQFNLTGIQTALTCPCFSNRQDKLKGEVDNADALKFMLAGMSEFILISGKTGKRLVYKLDKKESNKSKDGEKQYVYWLNTAEKNGTMIYAGVLFFDSNDSKFKFGKGARGNLTNDDIRVKSILYVLNALQKGKTDINVTVMHTGKCGKCGKKLTDPESIAIGLGPKCAKESHIPK